MGSGAPPHRLLLATALAVAVATLPGCRRGPEPAASPDDAAAGLEGAAAAQLGRELDEIVATYRKVIVLTSDEATLPASDQALVPIVGKMLFDRNLPRLELLRQRLVHDLDVAAADPAFQPPPALVEAFLDRLESDPGWRDADKLVFRDLLSDVTRHLAGRDPESPLGMAFLTRLEADRAAVDDIQERYDEELAGVFSRIGTRGMTVTREAWEDYVAHLRTLFTARGVVDELRDEVAPFLPASETRGGAGGSRALNGRSLPPKTLVLTFDDGPHPRHTKAVLDVLARFGLRSIFFKVGQNVGRIDADGKVRTTGAAEGSLEVRRAGHLVAHHSYTHALLPKLSADELDSELDLTTRVLEEAVEVHPALFRPPYGALSDKVRDAVAARDLTIMLWNVDSRDWADPVPRSIASRVIEEARQQGRGVLLFHDIHARTIEALPLVIETLRDEGFRFVLWDGEKILDDEPGTVAATPPAAALYGESFAVVIGIDAYEHWPRLAYAAADARAVRDVLVERFAFPPENVFLLLDGEATRENILRLLGDTLADPRRVGPDARVLVFFAGHGATRQLASGRHLGYIVPVEADARSFHGQAISMTQLQDVNEAIAAKHVLYLMDACYGGLALVRSGPPGFDPGQYLREVTSRPARQMLTAGGTDEEVADGGPGGHSIFTFTVLEGLRGMADLNGDHHVTAAELFAFAAPRVSGQSRQTPAFGNLVGSSGGEFVFALARGGWSAEESFLTELSRQLDDEALRLEAELSRYREEIAEKRRQNRERAAELAELKAAAAETGSVPPRRTPAEEARDLINEGLVRYREKRVDDALALFLQAFELQPSNALAANNVGFAYYKLGRFAEACEWYEKTLSLDPDRAVAHLNLGEALDKLGRAGDAAAAFRRFLELAPEHSGAAGARERLEEMERGGPSS